jgi:hypothetical protein
MCTINSTKNRQRRVNSCYPSCSVWDKELTKVATYGILTSTKIRLVLRTLNNKISIRLITPKIRLQIQRQRRWQIARAQNRRRRRRRGAQIKTS